MKFRLKMEMFLPDGCVWGHANDCQLSKFVDRANALLEAHEKTLPRMYGGIGNSEGDLYWSRVMDRHNDTHTALLWGIESIEDGK